MDNPLEDLITVALAGERTTHYEALPEDFGSEGSRWPLLQKCLAVVVERYPLLKLELSGSLETLRKFGLTPARAVSVGRQTVSVHFGRTERLGALRIRFSRAALSARRLASPQMAELSGE